MRRAFAAVAAALLLAGCGAASPPQQRRTPPAQQRRAGTPPPKQRRGGGIPGPLLAGARPIGRGPRFQPPLRGSVPGACSARLGRRLEAHVELFAANRVVLLAAGIGTRGPWRLRDGRLTHARCFGDLVTLDPTGTIYLRPGLRLTVGDLFRAWGQPLGRERIAAFTGGHVRVYVDGVAHGGAPAALPLTNGAEIVLEIGPRVPPHAHFPFPPAPPRRLG